MANLERGAHEPTNVYAFDPNDEDGDIEESRLPLLIAIALVVLAAFAGVVWLAYTQGVEEGRADAPRIAAAQPNAGLSPARKQPGKPQTNPYAGLNIYQPIANSPDANAPPPAQEQAPPPASTAPVLRPSASPAPEKPAAVVQPAPPKIAPAPVAVPKADMQTLQKTVIAAPAARVRKTTPVVAPAQHPVVDTAPQSSAGALLQIGSYKSDAEARASWNRFKARHAIASGYSPDVREVDLGAKGVWYRLRIGSFADRHAAAAFCDKLKAQGANCLVSQ